MYPEEVRQDAVSFFKQGFNPRQVTRLLCGPSWWSVNRWYEEFFEIGSVHVQRAPREQKFTEAQKRAAVDHYLANGKNQSKTVEVLGYPSRPLLCKWVDELAPGERRKTKPYSKANAATLDDKVELLVNAYSPGE